MPSAGQETGEGRLTPITPGTRIRLSPEAIRDLSSPPPVDGCIVVLAPDMPLSDGPTWMVCWTYLDPWGVLREGEHIYRETRLRTMGAVVSEVV